MTHPLVSIVIPHFQTPDLAKLCLRSIREHTRDVPYEVIVVDNDSRDDRSLNYLRSVEWIRLIERTDVSDNPATAHKEAVDLGFTAATAPFVMAFHTDSIPIRHDWLSWHVGHLTADPRIAAVGTYKLELKSPWLLRLRTWTDRLLSSCRRSSEPGDHRPYIRSHCALYRRDVLEQLGLSYNGDPNATAGCDIHFELERHGHVAKLLSVEETLQRVVHLNHGTMVLLPELGAPRRTIRKGRTRIERFLARSEIRDVCDNASLDKAA